MFDHCIGKVRYFKPAALGERARFRIKKKAAVILGPSQQLYTDNYWVKKLRSFKDYLDAKTTKISTLFFIRLLFKPYFVKRKVDKIAPKHSPSQKKV